MSPVIETGIPVDGAEEALKFENAPYGTYDLMVTSIELQTSKKTERPMWQVDAEIVESPDPKFNGVRMRTWLMIPSNGNNKGCNRTREFTIATGKPWNGGPINNDDYVGRRLKAIVKIGEPRDNGMTFNEIESYVTPQ